MKFAYIGLKTDGERAFKEKTGIEWMPGSAHEVTDGDVCAEMLKHPTIWEVVGPVNVKLSDAKKPIAFSGPVTDEDVTNAEESAQSAKKVAATVTAADPLAGMDDTAVKEFAKAQDLKIQGMHLFKADNLRAKVLAALSNRK